LGSTLFALAIHPVLLEIGQRHPDVLITAYADNVIFTGPLSKITLAHATYCGKMQEIGLEINSMESALYTQQWASLDDPSLLAREDVLLAQPAPGRSASSPLLYRTFNNEHIPIVRHGLKVLGAPIGSQQYCAQLVRKVINSIKQDLDLLSAFDLS
jgi:hypothetical protein